MKIKGERIYLRSLTKEDSGRIAKYGNNRKIWKNLTNVFPSPYTKQKALKRIKKIKNKKDLISLGVIYQEELVGEVIASFREDVDSKKVFIACWIGEPYWDLDLESEAIGIFSKFLLKNFPIKKVQARVFSWDIVSMKALKKNGFKLEGTIRSGIYKNGKYCDEQIYGVFKKELNQN